MYTTGGDYAKGRASGNSRKENANFWTEFALAVSRPCRICALAPWMPAWSSAPELSAPSSWSQPSYASHRTTPTNRRHRRSRQTPRAWRTVGRWSVPVGRSNWCGMRHVCPMDEYINIRLVIRVHLRLCVIFKMLCYEDCDAMPVVMFHDALWHGPSAQTLMSGTRWPGAMSHVYFGGGSCNGTTRICWFWFEHERTMLRTKQRIILSLKYFVGEFIYV